MLAAHLNAIEKKLAQDGRVPANAGHSLHKGTPREWFIREFLTNHLSENLAIGTGEIIDCDSAPGAPRNQFDIVVYKKSYPKLDFGGGISGFLIESVVATIEVKSMLDQAGIKQAVTAARNCKALKQSIVKSFTSGWVPPKALNFVVAYDGPAKMETVLGWIGNAHSELGIPLPAWTKETALTTAGTALDGVFVLERGFVKLENQHIHLVEPQPTFAPIHAYCDTATGNIFLLFLILQAAVSNAHGAWLDPLPYASRVALNGVRGEGIRTGSPAAPT